MEGLFVLMFFLSIFSMIAFVMFAIADIASPDSIIKAFFLQRKILKLLDPKTNITKENLRERKIDLKFLEDLLEEGSVILPPVKIFIERLFLSYDFVKKDLFFSHPSYIRGRLEINKYSGMNKDILREIIKSWSSHIETLEAEDNLEKEIEFILSEEIEKEIENAEKEASLQKSPTKRSKRNAEVHVTQEVEVSYR